MFTETLGLECVTLPADPEAHIDLGKLGDHLGCAEIDDLLLERQALLEQAEKLLRCNLTGTSLEDDLSELRRAVTTTTTTTTNSPSSDGDGEREGPTPGWKLSCLVARVGEKAIQQAEREAAR